MPILSVAELSAFMGKEFTTAETAQAESVIETVSAFISEKTGLAFTAVVDERIIIPADGHGIIEFNKKPVTAVTAVYDLDGSEVLDCRFDGMAAISGLYPNQVVEIVYSYGMSSVPEDIKGVVKGAAARVMYNPAGLRQETVGAISVTYPGIGGEAGTINFSSLEKEILERYERREASMRMAVTHRRLAGLPILTLNNSID